MTKLNKDLLNHLLSSKILSIFFFKWRVITEQWKGHFHTLMSSPSVEQKHHADFVVKTNRDTSREASL